jgi:hypothetical protein
MPVIYEPQWLESTIKLINNLLQETKNQLVYKKDPTNSSCLIIKSTIENHN